MIEYQKLRRQHLSFNNRLSEVCAYRIALLIVMKINIKYFLTVIFLFLNNTSSIGGTVAIFLSYTLSPIVGTFQLIE